MTTHQAPKMESGEGLPISQDLPNCQEEGGGKGDLISLPAAIEAACEATVSVIRESSPQMEDTACEEKGETKMETSLTGEETDNKMEDSSKEQVQGSSGSGGEPMDTSEGEKKTSLTTTENSSSQEPLAESGKASDNHDTTDNPPAATTSTATPTTPPTAPPTTQSSKPFNCACGRTFDTQRGLSMHWAHEKGHRKMDPNKSSEDAATSEPTSPRTVTPSPLQSPTSTAPESPPYNMASFKTSARNPQYYSIIRTRRSSEHHPSSSTSPSTGSAAVEVGTKRPRGSTSTSTTPPAKAMQLNTGEKVPVVGTGGGGEEAGEGEKDQEEVDMAAASSSQSPQKRRLREKESKKESSNVQQRPRTRSLSSSDNTSPPLKSSLSVPADTSGSGKGGVAGPRSSPVTRSNAATMKTHEFVSLPARRRRGGRRGRGRGGGGAGGRGQDHMEEDSVEMDDSESHFEDQGKEEDPDPPQQAPPQIKRRRGRPPKNKGKEAAPPSSSGGSKSAPSSTHTTPNVHPSPSGKQTRTSGRGGRGGRAAMERESAMEEQEENPLNIKGSKLPPWENESEEQTPAKPPSSKASTPSSEPASLPPTKSTKSETSSSSASSSSTKDSGKAKNQDTDTSGTTQPSQGTRRGRKKTSTSVDSSKTENSSEVAEEGEKEIKTRSKARSSRKASESQLEKTEKEAQPGANTPAKESEELKDSTASSTTASRPSSVIVSVVSSGSDKKESAVSAENATEEQREEKSSQPNGSVEDKTASSSGGDGQQFKHPAGNESVPPMMGYPPPPTSAPTPTYHYPYPQGAYPPPHHMMYPPGPASSMYPYYYHHPGSAGNQPPHMMPHPYHLSQGIPPPPVMIPPEQQGGTGTGLPSPHHSMNPFQFQTTVPSPNGAPNTTAIAISSSSTTVGGVRVTLLDKPPTQMPTVTVPHPNVSRQSLTNVYPGHTPMADHPTSPMGQVPLIRPPYQIPTPGAHSPEGMQPHPLSQVYRMSYPGSLPHPHQAHYPHHHPAHPHLAVRFDAGGHPYMNWESKPPPPEEQPAQPVECPECHRMFKNNKALNGHMRLHGGFDWTKRPFSVDQKQSSSSTSNNTESGSGGGETDGKGGKTAAAKTKKESRSRSRSRSKSPAPNANSTKQAAKRRTSSEEKSGLVNKKLEGLPVPRAPNVFTFDTKDHHTSSRTPMAHHHGDSGMHDAGTMTFSNQPSAHRNATLDDLVRAAEELERIENGSDRKSSHDVGGANTSGGSDVDEPGKRRPGNITIPQSHSNPSPAIEREKHRFGATPPYTPPPLLSPSRSLTMLATAAGAPQPCTPSRILHPWTSRRSSEGHKPSESDDSYTEPKINVGSEFQAVLPECSPTHEAASQDDYRSTKVWEPLKDLTHEDESIIDGYLQLACSPAVLYGGRNMELAYHFLYQLRGSVKEAVRVLLSGKSVFPEGDPVTSYNYCGSKRWSGKERQQFRRAWRVHRKQFQLLRSAVDSKSFQEVTEFYYTWKKYCSDEYRGRNRHTSEEILSDEDNAYPQVPSSGSSASVENETLDGAEMEHSSSNQNQAFSAKNDKTRNNKNASVIAHSMAPPTHPSVGGPGGYHQPRHYGNATSGIPHHMDYDPFPVVYSAHKHGQVNQYKCKYPGCNQVFTSIFALNGHIRVHGGSFYPRPSSGSTSSSASSHHHAPSTGSTSSSYSSKSHGGQSQKSSFDSRSPQQLDIAKALLDLPQSRSPAKGGGSYSSPSSQKSSPGKSRSPATTKKKMSSSSPGEREGYYPCNRCGRVFTKVKSRSAHMKSHIIKQN